jgi:hypothetical protein
MQHGSLVLEWLMGYLSMGNKGQNHQQMRHNYLLEAVDHFIAHALPKRHLLKCLTPRLGSSSSGSSSLALFPQLHIEVELSTCATTNTDSSSTTTNERNESNES